MTLVWSILSFLDAATAEKSQNFKGIVTERWRLPSQMPFAYAASLSEGAASKPGDIKPDDSMTWQFYGGTLDPGEADSREQPVRHCDRTAQAAHDDGRVGYAAAGGCGRGWMRRSARWSRTGKAIIMGQGPPGQPCNKRVGERIKLYGINYREIDLELEIVGTFPEGRYDNTAAINRDYLLAGAWMPIERQTGKPHPLADKTLNLVWLRVPDSESFGQVADQILTSPQLHQPGGQVRDGRLRHRVVSGCLSRFDLGHALAVGAGDPDSRCRW